jgi:hypothetical protein
MGQDGWARAAHNMSIEQVFYSKTAKGKMLIILNI